MPHIGDIYDNYERRKFEVGDCFTTLHAQLKSKNNTQKRGILEYSILNVLDFNKFKSEFLRFLFFLNKTKKCQKDFRIEVI